MRTPDQILTDEYNFYSIKVMCHDLISFKRSGFIPTEALTLKSFILIIENEGYPAAMAKRLAEDALEDYALRYLKETRIISSEKVTLVKPSKKIVYFDMDGLLADFAKGLGNDTYEWIDDPPEMFEKGFFRNLPVVPGAREAMTELLTFKGIDIYIASKPTVKKTQYCPSEKYEWIKEHFPELLRNVFLTCDKSKLLGDYLVDDLEKWGKDFQGKFIHFIESTPEESWKKVVEYFRRYQE